jgi:hypothetical protein
MSRLLRVLLGVFFMSVVAMTSPNAAGRRVAPSDVLQIRVSFCHRLHALRAELLQLRWGGARGRETLFSNFCIQFLDTALQAGRSKPSGGVSYVTFACNFVCCDLLVSARAAQ